jgi:peptide methionine sulfoxide reductase MsrA
VQADAGSRPEGMHVGVNRQGNDVGIQYRSAIFPQTPEQKNSAERVKARVEASGAQESRWIPVT